MHQKHILTLFRNIYQPLVDQELLELSHSIITDPSKYNGVITCTLLY